MTRLRRPDWFGPVEPSLAENGTKSTGSEKHDAGRAIIEVVFLAVLMLIPILYLLISLIRIQAATLAVTQAARDAGRAIDTSATIDDGIARARQIAAIDLDDQHIPSGNITLQFVRPGAACSADNAVTPSLTPGAVYDLCITTTLTLPGIPTILTGRNNTATGVYTVHISDSAKAADPMLRWIFRNRARRGDADAGSVTPLIIGMMLCLLILAAGITAAGSAFLAGQRTQHLCDGAAATAAGTVNGDNPDTDAAAAAAADYLATRGSNATTNLQFDGDTLTLTCATDSPITFGALFGKPTLPRTTTATARTTYRQ